MLLTVPVTHNLNIINDISTRRQGYCYFMILSVFLVLLVFYEKTKVSRCICLMFQLLFFSCLEVKSI